MTLTCDICGGALQMDPGGTTATCEFCGVKTSVERLREKIQEIKGTVQIEGTVATRQTGTAEDVEQWRALMGKYMAAGDFVRALDIVGKILESVPSDPEANAAYDELQVLKDMTVKNGVLEKYNGQATEVVIPSCVHTIGDSAFNLKPMLAKIVLLDTVTAIGRQSFGNCDALKAIVLSRNIKTLPTMAFWYCKGLEEITLPEGVEKIESLAFSGCKSLRKIVLPDSITDIHGEAFTSCESLEEVVASDRVLDECGSAFATTPYGQMVAANRRRARQARGLCRHCGGEFKGIFNKVCDKCGKPKDY